MKKSSRKLALHKDVVRTLVDRDLVNAQGGAADPSRKETFCDSIGATCNSTGIRCH
jgi:hypothetical protein